MSKMHAELDQKISEVKQGGEQVDDSERNMKRVTALPETENTNLKASEEMSKMHAELDQKISEVKQGGEQVDDSERNMKRVTALPETENTNLKASEEMSKMHAELDQKISEVKQGGEQVDDSERNMKRVTALPETENTNLKASEEMSKMHAELDQKISEVKQGGEQVDDSERNMKRVTALPETENTNLKASEEMSKMHAELDQKISVVKCPQSELSRQGVTQCPPNPSTIDRISKLPNDALVYILSLMGTREAIRTSVLSKQWKGLWTKTFNLRHTFNLCFYDSSVSSPTTSTLQRILSLHRAPMIKRLYLDQIDDGVWRHEAELLVSYAAERHVMFVELKSGYWCAPFQIPDGLLRNSSLRGLSIEYCNLFATTWVRWELLMYLHIFHSTLKDIEVVLSGCPFLESLKLYEVRLHNNFLIDHKKLKEMWMVGPISSREDEEELEVRVMAPNLTRLVINGEWEGISLLLIDVPALVYTCWDLNFQNVYLLYDNHVDGIQSVKGCFEMVRNCKELCLGSHFQKLIREVETDPFRAIISSWECVVIESVLLGDIDLLVPRVLNLLHHTPNLKRLVVVFSDGNDFALLPNDDFSFAIHPPDDNQFYGVDDWMLRTDLSPDHFFSMVKKIEIHGVILSQKWLEFIEFLLKYSNVLEEMFIYSSQGNCQASSFLKVVEVLRSFPVSSRRAKVILDRNPVKKRDDV